MAGRKLILGIHVRGKPLASDVDLEVIARQTPGFSGADIENVVNEAAILAARRNKKAISGSEIEEAIEKVKYGPERRSRVISKEELTITAYHEAGHAVVMHTLPNCDPVHKISIVARGMVGGLTMFLPEDRYLINRSKFEDDLTAALGGRAAEEVVFNDVTTGAKADLEWTTRVARAMVTQYGMSDKLGPLTFGEKNELVFLGREIGEQRNYSEAVAQEIDAEVKRIITQAYNRARQIIVERREKLEAVARRLLEKETIDRAEFEAIMA
jgi:cell division protease FtsH